MKKHIFMIFGIGIIFSYFYFNFLSTLSQNVVPVSVEEKNVIKFFFPQGWGFFTKNPRDAKYKLYKITETGQPELVNFKITSPSNWCGLSRKGNRISMEMIRIQKDFPNVSEWTVSNLDIDAFDVNKDTFEVIASNTKDLRYIKSGKYVVKEYFITPWNWLNYPDSYTREYKYYSFELK